uniref:COP9 signalosome complex subunit 5 n=1 Tax=Parastrongyloides trichosuri TaxID=131310 RepID=A0A0N4ZFK5_PARTI
MNEIIDSYSSGEPAPKKHMSSQAAVGLKQWELENDVKTVDEKFICDVDEQKNLREELKPWLTDQKYFKKVEISALALLKMSMHAKRGGDIEVMGVMQGKVSGNTMIVIDAIPLPVEGTETRVNAQEQANEYLVSATDMSQYMERMECVIGWYHSHPGYGCWLSGIDVETQQLHQQFNEPYLAVVIDPHKTSLVGKVEIGAFRTFKRNDSVERDSANTYVNKSIIGEKAKDYGAHAHKYYELDVSFIKHKLDSEHLDILWQSNWHDILQRSPLIENLGGIKNTLKMSIDEIKFNNSRFNDSNEYNLNKVAKKCKHLNKQLRHEIFLENLRLSIFNKNHKNLIYNHVECDKLLDGASSKKNDMESEDSDANVHEKLTDDFNLRVKADASEVDSLLE